MRSVETHETEHDLKWMGESAGAYLAEDADGRQIWLPKNQVEIEDGGSLGEVCGFLIPDWLAVDRGIA